MTRTTAALAFPPVVRDLQQDALEIRVAAHGDCQTDDPSRRMGSWARHDHDGIEFRWSTDQTTNGKSLKHETIQLLPLPGTDFRRRARGVMAFRIQ